MTPGRPAVGSTAGIRPLALVAGRGARLPGQWPTGRGAPAWDRGRRRRTSGAAPAWDRGAPPPGPPGLLTGGYRPSTSRDPGPSSCRAFRSRTDGRARSGFFNLLTCGYARRCWSGGAPSHLTAPRLGGHHLGRITRVGGEVRTPPPGQGGHRPSRQRRSFAGGPQAGGRNTRRHQRSLLATLPATWPPSATDSWRLGNIRGGPRVWSVADWLAGQSNIRRRRADPTSEPPAMRVKDADLCQLTM